MIDKKEDWTEEAGGYFPWLQGSSLEHIIWNKINITFYEDIERHWSNVNNFIYSLLGSNINVDVFVEILRLVINTML